MGRLREALDSVPREQGGKRCKFARFLDGLDAKDRAEMDELIDDREVYDWKLVNLCWSEFAFRISDTTIYRHRNGIGCGCE